MQPTPQTPTQIADSLFAQFSQGFSAQQLDEYGIASSPVVTTLLMKEVLALNLFWVHTAMEAHLTDVARDVISKRLTHLVQQAWNVGFHLTGPDREAFYQTLPHRFERYQIVVQQGGNPVSVFQETVSRLEADGVISPTEHSHVLALFIDFVPVDAYGELLEDILILEE